MNDFRPSFRVGTRVGVLRAIRKPQINVAVWERAMPNAVSDEIAGWGAQSPPVVDSILQSQSYDLSRVAPGLGARARSWLVNDIALLIGHFLALAEVQRFRLFFGVVRSDQCRKFHVDYVRLRLVTTYAGPGTEWLPDEAVDRRAMADASRPLAAEAPAEHRFDDANDRIVRNRQDVQRARAGQVLLLKGAQFDGTSGGAVHRSPPIDGSGATRVVLVVTAHRD